MAKIKSNDKIAINSVIKLLTELDNPNHFTNKEAKNIFGSDLNVFGKLEPLRKRKYVIVIDSELVTIEKKAEDWIDYVVMADDKKDHTFSTQKAAYDWIRLCQSYWPKITYTVQCIERHRDARTIEGERYYYSINLDKVISDMRSYYEEIEQTFINVQKEFNNLKTQLELLDSLNNHA